MKNTLISLCSLSIIFFLQLSIINGAPRKPLNTYDQRQDGKFNVHAKLDNFLIVIAPTSSSSSLASSEFAELLQNNDLVAQALDLKTIATRIVENQSVEPVTNDREEKIIDIMEKNSSNRDSSIKRIIDEELTKISNNNNDRLSIITVVEKKLPVDLENSEKLSESENNNDDEEKINNDSSVILQNESTDFNEGKLKKESRSLKTQLGEISIVKLPSNSDTPIIEENKIVSIGNKLGNNVEVEETQELKLIGDGIENCGPERFRDRFGICQFRVKS